MPHANKTLELAWSLLPNNVGKLMYNKNSESVCAQEDLEIRHSGVSESGVEMLNNGEIGIHRATSMLVPPLEERVFKMMVNQNTEERTTDNIPQDVQTISQLSWYSGIQSLFTRRQCRTLFLAYQTIGVVYGGLVTSPLYLYPSMSFAELNEDDYLGIFSIIFWTLTMMGLIKYVFIVLQADDHGEGGTFALYSLLCQHANIAGQISSKNHYTPIITNSNAGHAKPGSVQFRVKSFLEGSRIAQIILFAVTVFGMCMLIGDGILTPAISVLSAVSGLKIAAPLISQTAIVVISAVLLVALFLVQRFGTHHVSFVFSPIMVLWLITTPLIGAYNIIVHYPKIFKAISPHYILSFFSRHGKQGWYMLGDTVLCITGAEAMFADLGLFTRESMQIAFTFGVYPSNLITYAGQTAYLIKNPKALGQTFFFFVPTPVFWPMFFISTFAAIVASQGLISGCFSLVKQSVVLDYFPRVRLIHTSKKHEGQIYSPEVNYLLMILCTGVVVGFREGAALGNAFGVTVIGVMLITTLFVSLVMIVVWGTALPLALTFLLIFAIIEGSYVSAVLSKVPQGGWLPFLIGSILAAVMFSWVYGRRTKNQYEIANSISLNEMGSLLSSASINRVPGLCFFYSSSAEEVPPVLRHYLKTVRSVHRVAVLTVLKYKAIPKVPKAERFDFKHTGYKGIYRCIAQYGYADIQDDEWSGFSDRLMEALATYIRSLAARNAGSKNKSFIREEHDEEGTGGNLVGVDGLTGAELLEEDLAEIEIAGKAEGPVFVVGRAEMRVKEKEGASKERVPIRRWLINKVYGLIHKICISKLSFLNLRSSSLVEIGVLYEV